MSAEVELLREAARRLRAQAVDGNPNPWARPDMDGALADWLDAEANLHESVGRAEGKVPDGWRLRITSSTLAEAATVARAVVGGAARPTAEPGCACTIDPDGARNTDGCVTCDLPPCGFLVDEVGR
ncbi:hypothetical protein [Micromonospora sp. NPDC005174]|uniref:hypothetical protein n=1 Tax=Micromonospora sp. NPDC005174 TaxID=3157018 RepID=UPI0033A5A878